MEVLSLLLLLSDQLHCSEDCVTVGMRMANRNKNTQTNKKGGGGRMECKCSGGGRRGWGLLPFGESGMEGI